ncbi:hypothetical protein AVEN_10700-1 [Araneus ventricosus]|uniref:Uncharacterized protein n=1 Tax=Araneus ventricosus TaxID=182803 RepID=A0A4Y2FML3_ARAVE|nr:hypothetical protein AVEN_10700-1 [Araneus ventricosus]
MSRAAANERTILETWRQNSRSRKMPADAHWHEGACATPRRTHARTLSFPQVLIFNLGDRVGCGGHALPAVLAPDAAAAVAALRRTRSLFTSLL